MPLQMVPLSRRISVATRRSGCVPQPERDVDVVVVERQPDFRLLGGRAALLRLDLDEVGNRRHRRRRAPRRARRRSGAAHEAHGAERGAARVIARNQGTGACCACWRGPRQAGGYTRPRDRGDPLETMRRARRSRPSGRWQLVGDRRAELQHAAVLNARGLQPPRTVVGVQHVNGRPVEHVVDVEVALEAARATTGGCAWPAAGRGASCGRRTSCPANQRHGGGRRARNARAARRQVAPERRRDLRVGGRVVRRDLRAREFWNMALTTKSSGSG